MLSRRSFATLLALTPGIGGKSITRILARNELLSRSPEEFLTMAPEVWREEYSLSTRQIESLKKTADGSSERIQALEKRAQELGIGLITAIDAHYPQLIEEMDPDPPGVLFLYGNSSLLNANTFCVMSSRDTRPAELDKIDSLTEEGVMNAEILVTGHDTLAFQRSAVVPLRWGAPRILCLDRGFFKVLGEDLKSEAFRAARLWRYEFDPTTDLAITPFRPDADYHGVNNQVRDKLVATLSKRLDFVKIGDGGNMNKLAKMAMQAGRKVRVCDCTLNYRRWTDAGAELIRT